MGSFLKSLIHPLRTPASWALQQGLLPSSARKVMPWSWGIEPFTIRVDGCAFRYFPSAIDTVAQKVFWMGFRQWEPETVPVFLKLLRQSRSFIDVGANCGIYTMLACAVNPAIQVTAVEPVPKIHAALANNVRCGNLEQRVQLVQAALSTSEGMAQFHECVDPTMGSLATEGYFGKPGTIIEVRTTTLDTVASKLAIPPDFIKIDVEGFEDVVLDGGRNTLEKAQPMIILEANSGGPHLKMTAILSQYGYSFHYLNEAGISKRAAIVPDPASHCNNWLCVPPGQPIPHV